MGRWWGRGRSPQADVKAVSREAESDSGWRGLAPIEPTVGSFAPTAQLHGFRSTLTTAHNPGLTAPPAAMSTSHGDQLSVMRLISEPVPESPPAKPRPRPSRVHGNGRQDFRPNSHRWIPHRRPFGMCRHCPRRPHPTETSNLAPAPMLTPARWYVQPIRKNSGRCRW